MIGTGEIKIHIGMEDGATVGSKMKPVGSQKACHHYNSSPCGEFSVHLSADHGIPEQLLCLDEAILGAQDWFLGSSIPTVSPVKT